MASSYKIIAPPARAHGAESDENVIGGDKVRSSFGATSSKDNLGLVGWQALRVVRHQRDARTRVKFFEHEAHPPTTALEATP